MSAALLPLLYIVIFPGFLFLSLFSMMAEYVDRKFHAKLQNRIGPPWFQPFADFLKLVSKEDIVPELADTTMFKFAPVAALTATVAAFIYVPVWKTTAPYSFDGDLIVVLYLLTIPTMTFFIGGWYSRSMYAMIGAVRSVMQLFAYEVPLFLSILAPALLANTWSLSGIAEFYSKNPLLSLCNVIGFCISMVAMLGKLEKVPFDIPEAETEIVAGSFTEYSGRLYALFRLTLGIEMVVGCSVIAAVFLPFGMGFGPVVGFVAYLVKVMVLVCIISLLRTVMARLRIDQMINFCWQIAAPLAFAQLVINLIIKEGFLGK